MPAYSKSPYRVNVSADGKILVNSGDTLSKYSWAIYGNYTTLDAFRRLNGTTPIPIADKNLIIAGETLIHMPDYKPGTGNRPGNGGGGGAPGKNPSGGFVHHPTSDYRLVFVQNHPVYLSPELLADGNFASTVTARLGEDLSIAHRALPAYGSAILWAVPFWIEHDNPDHPSLVYHPSKNWLVNNGYNTDKAKSIEVGTPGNYLSWRAQQPYMVLHELAHAYKDRVSPFGDAKLQFAFQAAVSSRRYESVGYVMGGNRRAYALTNESEYFAELSEAYFGKNDYYPFTRADLVLFDPIGYQMIEEVWRVR